MAELLIEYFAPYRQKRQQLGENPGYVKEVLSDGVRRARAVASQILSKVRDAVGLGAKNA